MNCPICHDKSKVIDSRYLNEVVLRKRQCLECDYKWNTTEMDMAVYNAAEEMKEVVEKAAGIMETMQRTVEKYEEIMTRHSIYKSHKNKMKNITEYTEPGKR